MKQRLSEKLYENHFVITLLVLLFSLPLHTVAQQDTLIVTFHQTSIDETEIRGLTADFPSPVISIISASR